MKQYIELLKQIKEKGTYKPAAREGMPGTLSLFGHQFRHDLSEGFPLLTTKKINFSHVVTELLWFLRGDVNIKYLVDNGVNIWNEDAYNYYKKVGRKNHLSEDSDLSFESFVSHIKNGDTLSLIDNYTLGDCGFQYGRVWRGFGEAVRERGKIRDHVYTEPKWNGGVDQIEKVIRSLQNSPEGRRHIVTAIDPLHDEDLALYWCHSMFQFNCRPLSAVEREDYYAVINTFSIDQRMEMNPNASDEDVHILMDEEKIPRYYLDCQMYQRSADVFLGVPYNLASYSLLTHIIAKICNMIPGEFIHTFGDVHIYDNHKEQVEEQLLREPATLPTLEISDEGNDWAYIRNTLDFSLFDTTDFTLENYNPMERIKAKLSTGLK